MRFIEMNELKNIAELERCCKEENGPIYVTKNGCVRLVVMDINHYEKNIQKMYEALIVIEGFEDIKTGKTVDGKKAIKGIKERYGI